MNTYLLIFTLAAVSSLVITPIVRRLCQRWRLLDEPRDDRRTHEKSTPRLGGIAIFLSVLIALSPLLFVHNSLTSALTVARWRFVVVLLPAALVFLFGVYDDLRGSRAWMKFLAQGLAGALLYALGGRIEVLSVPFVGSVELPMAVGIALTIIWTVAITNAFNLIDGIDGLAAGAGLFAAFVMVIVSLPLYNPLVTVMALALAGALIGFLRYNFNPASIFLGDSGSLFMGFMLAALSVQGTQKASTVVAIMIPVLAFGVPMVDTGFTMVRRFISGKPLFQGDREHIHHMLLARGWSQRRVAFVLYCVCAAFGLMAMLFVGETGRTSGLMLFVIGVAVIFAVGRLRYHEIDELKAGVKRNVGERRQRTANNLRVRRATRALSEAKTLEGLFGAVETMLEFGEFVYAVAQVGFEKDSARNKRVLARSNTSGTLRSAELSEGFIRWTWERGDIEAEKVIGSDRCWTLRLPLSTDGATWGYMNLYRLIDADHLMLDINYLCHLFQREMALAVERVVSMDEEEFKVSKPVPHPIGIQN
jgi:UDP-GlcNAc:undecaprenyl-phosphate GlcNAc-1-phosphate transferase